jgi:hypothetical protein
MNKNLLNQMVLDGILDNEKEVDFCNSYETKLLSNRWETVVNIYVIIRKLKRIPLKKHQEFLVEMPGRIIKNRSVLFLEIRNDTRQTK